MPQEKTSRDEVLAAMAQIAALADVARDEPGAGLPAAELQALVDGHEYAGQIIPPYVRLLSYAPGEEIVREGEVGDDRFFFVVSGVAEVFLRRGAAKVGELQPGTLFGEMAVLNHVPRTATVSASSTAATEVLEVQRPALRWLRKIPAFAEALDRTYRRNSRAVALQDVGAATRLDAEALDRLAKISQFRVYEAGHQLFVQGEPVRRLFVLMNGWIRLSQILEPPVTEADGAANEAATAARNSLASKSSPSNSQASNSLASKSSPGQSQAGKSQAGKSQAGKSQAGKSLSNEPPTALDFLGAGHCFGLEAVSGAFPWPQTGDLLTRAEVLEVSLPLLREAGVLLEDIQTGLKKLAPPVDLARQPQPLPIATAQRTLIQTGVADTHNLLAIDAQRCTRCGNCSQTCHEIHGHSRLSRRGFYVQRPPTVDEPTKTQPLIVPSACHHCRQPECLNGCPVNAIHQLADGRVELDMQRCIGCGDCAALCPYDAIRLVPRNDQATTTEAVPLVALKCDLCASAACNAQPGPPHIYGCETNCPTGALRRIKPPLQLEELHTIEQPRVRRVRAKKKEQRYRWLPAWRMDVVEWRLHVWGSAFNAVLASLLALQWQHGGPLLPHWHLWHWLTGSFGLLGLAGTWVYAWRKRQRSGRFGALRHWLLAHHYTAIATVLLFALHSGTQFLSPLTKILAVALGLAWLSGAVGQVLNWVVPRWLTARERQPWLLEDLLARRAELQADPLAHIADAVTLKQLNQLIWLQRLLRGWILPHVLLAAGALVLVLLHLWQVVFFHWR